MHGWLSLEMSVCELLDSGEGREESTSVAVSSFVGAEEELLAQELGRLDISPLSPVI